MNKKILAAILLVALSVIFFVYQKYNPTDQTKTIEQREVPEQKEVVDNESIKIAWLAKEEPSGQYDEPRERIHLRIEGEERKDVELGIFSGCRSTKNNKIGYATENTVLELYCWWAGAGDYLTVEYNNNDTLKVLVWEMGEGISIDSNQPQTLAEIKISTGSKILTD